MSQNAQTDKFHSLKFYTRAAVKRDKIYGHSEARLQQLLTTAFTEVWNARRRQPHEPPVHRRSMGQRNAKTVANQTENGITCQSEANGSSPRRRILRCLIGWPVSASCCARLSSVSTGLSWNEHCHDETLLHRKSLPLGFCPSCALSEVTCFSVCPVLAKWSHLNRRADNWNGCERSYSKKLYTGVCEGKRTQEVLAGSMSREYWW